MGHFPAFFSWSNLRVWCSRSLNWSKMGLPQPDLSFPIPSPFLWAHSWNVSCLEANLFFCLTGWFFSLFVCLFVGFGLFSVKGTFSLCELHYCGAAHSVTVQAPAPLFFGGGSGCVPGEGWRQDGIHLSLSVGVLFNNVDIRDQFLEEWDSTTQYSDWYCSLTPEKLMATLPKFLSLL